MKAILIARVSTEEQKEAGNSLPAQVERLKAYCHRKDFDILDVCSFDESAYKEDRDEFDRIVDLVLEQTEKVVVCCDKVDRLSRNLFDRRIPVLYERALNDDIELHFVSDGQVINKHISAVEKFQFGISLGLAKYYSDAISDNVKRAQEQMLRNGVWLAKAPYGYKNITQENGTKDIIVDEYGAHVVRKLYELYASGAFSLEQLAKKFRDEHGVPWPKGTVGKMLRNPFYYGVMVVKGKEYPHRYPPLISKTLFDQAQEVKENFKKKPYKYAGKPYFYRGILRCAHCGLAITPEKHKGLVYYHCTQYRGKHGAQWLREEKITEELGKAFKAMQMPKDILEQIKETLNDLNKAKIDFHNKELSKITREQKEITKRLDNLYIDKLDGRITEAQYDRFYQSFREKEENLEIRLEHLQEAEDNYYMTSRYILSLVNKAYDLFKCSEVEERRQLIKLVLSNLRVKDGNVLYDVVKPFDLLVNATDRKQWRG